MGTRTVRLDEEAEKTLEEIKRATGMSVSSALKRGLIALREEIAQRPPAEAPYDIYETLDLGPGGYANASSGRTRDGVRDAIRRKLNR
ncbi:MAG: hypothetical protein ACR2RB_19970 [Gammaproteobacteria bacterium]